ncbi:hypothetical protein QQY66_48675 [Streptomyces sp. DG2A-72]|uniref:DUF6851 domain-containing protein n=1 Tax=Streptomyces sp. DG2A-72 TaxID=3051386 RepID=UPI00265B99F1|nr:hypothetical protein [Streptomyces sp. DG2A-72]MDO0939194.1 hypothetical protein [Streptomyces sp. DG2A-72]
MDVTVILWMAHVVLVSWFDAVTPSHPTAVGVHARIPRRPSSESTNRTMNIACLHAQYQVIRVILPKQVPGVRSLFAALGLNPDDESENLTSPVGIGDVAGTAAVKARLRDGMNFLGNEGRKYDGQPFEDYTGDNLVEP